MQRILATTPSLMVRLQFAKLHKTGAGDRQTGAEHHVTNGYALSLNSGSSASPTFDANGNMTQDQAGNSYSWDCENRLISILYPGSGNHSDFTYDPFGSCVKIVEVSGGTTTSTTQLIWSNRRICETRNNSSSVISQYFAYGQTLSGSNYYYSTDHPASVREMCDNSGNIKAQYIYDPYGRATKIQGTLDSDFQYDAYYSHSRSGLNLTIHRQYLSSLGRWLSRDPWEVREGLIPYTFVGNDPIGFFDPYGLYRSGLWCGPGWANGAPMSESNPNLPRDSRCGAAFHPPESPLDWCCWMHDLCHHWAHGLPKNQRKCVSKDCDRKLADCGTAAGSSMFANLFSGLGTGFTPHSFGSKGATGIPDTGVFGTDPWIPPTPDSFPLQTPLTDPFDPNPNDPNGGCSHGTSAM